MVGVLMQRWNQMQEQGETGGASEIAPKEKSKPQFSVKMKGGAGFVGSGWLNESQYGKYVSVKINSDIPAGSTIYVSPNKANPAVLG